MKNNKKIYISIGVVLSIIAIAWSVFSDSSNTIESIDFAGHIKIIINVAITFILLGMSEGFYIKSGIVPKWIRYIIYGQWIVVPIILITTIVDVLL